MRTTVRDLWKIRGNDGFTTLRIGVNVLTYAALRGALTLRFVSSAKAVAWVEAHSHLYWTRFPFCLEGETVWNPWVRGWTDFLGFLSCGGDDLPADWCCLEPGDVALEIGAHRGYQTQTIRYARKVGEEGVVVAVEPHPDNFAWLIHNLAANGIGNVVPVRAACWREKALLHLQQGADSSRHRVVAPRGSDGAGVWVQGTTVDGLVHGLGLTKVDWIEVDVEGAECEVLEGARCVLQRFRPSLLAEVHGTWEPLTALLASVDYRVESVKGNLAHAGSRGFILARPG